MLPITDTKPLIISAQLNSSKFSEPFFRKLLPEIPATIKFRTVMKKKLSTMMLSVAIRACSRIGVKFKKIITANKTSIGIKPNLNRDSIFSNRQNNTNRFNFLKTLYSKDAFFKNTQQSFHILLKNPCRLMFSLSIMLDESYTFFRFHKPCAINKWLAKGCLIKVDCVEEALFFIVPPKLDCASLPITIAYLVSTTGPFRFYPFNARRIRELHDCVSERFFVG
jgi:hypothetical protein